MDPIDETLKKIAAATARVNSPISTSIEPHEKQSSLLGDPNCPICGGVGFVRQDLPISHPDFGKLQVCVCRQKSIVQSTQQRLFRLSNLDSFESMTFESFNPTGRGVGMGDNQFSSLKYAFNQAQHFAQNLKGWLLLMGGYGCGKTHLAAAIAIFAVNLGVPTLFLTVPDLLDWLRFSYDSPEATFEQRFDEIRNIGLLVLDDLGTQNATPWAQEKLYQIINHRYTAKLPMVITTNLNMDEIDGRMSSRLKDPDLVTGVTIVAPDFRVPSVDSIHPALSSLQLLAGRAFGNFSLRENERLPDDQQRSLENAFRSAHAFAEKPHGWIVFLGTYGTGKTHLAASIGNLRLAMGESPMFVVVPDLLDHLRSTFSPTSSISYDKLFEEVRTCHLLILDDLGTQSATPWAKEKLYQIFNYRYNAGLPTVITTSMLFDEIDPRIRSRMNDKRLCEVIPITAPSYRNMGTAEKPKRVRKTT
jgi:DNA replication protein DnaC